MGIIAIDVANATPGTPLRIYSPGSGNPPVPVVSGSIALQADPSNAGKVYIGTKGMVKGTTPATRVNVLAILTAGQMWPSSELCLNPEFLYIDVDTAGDGILLAVAG